MSIATADQVKQKIKLRASVNKWITENFPRHRKFLSHKEPVYNESEKAWEIDLYAKDISGHAMLLERLFLREDAKIEKNGNIRSITKQIEELLSEQLALQECPASLEGSNCAFKLGDGIAAAEKPDDREVDLFLTDPPCGISKAYACEKQVPRRLRKDGKDFIMPKGNFGDWDGGIEPLEWFDILLPKAGGRRPFAPKRRLGSAANV